MEENRIALRGVVPRDKMAAEVEEILQEMWSSQTCPKAQSASRKLIFLLGWKGVCDVHVAVLFRVTSQDMFFDGSQLSPHFSSPR